MKKHKKLLTIIIHIAVWGSFFLLPYIFRPQGKGDIPASISNRFIAVFTTNVVCLIAFYYLNTLILLPSLLFKRKWVLYLISIVVCFVFFMYVPREIANVFVAPEDVLVKFEVIHEQNKQAIIDTLQYWKMRQHGGINGHSRFVFFPGSNAIFFLVCLISICISVTQQWLKAEQITKEIETEKLNTELSFLKSQVNPHFFFNTLNNIYSLAVVGSDKTAPTIMKLSAIMRYILTDTQNDLVPLENEVNFINNFIDLQRVRLTDKVTVSFVTQGNISNHQVAPLLFIPFVENAFKYGVSTKETSIISITITATNNAVQLKTNNTIVKADNGILDTTGIGITNVKRRLDLLYVDKHTLQITNNETTFFVTLDITTT